MLWLVHCIYLKRVRDSAQATSSCSSITDVANAFSECCLSVTKCFQTLNNLEILNGLKAPPKSRNLQYALLQ